MATLPLVAPAIVPPAPAPESLAAQHRGERLLRGYLAIKSLCVLLDLPFEGSFFDDCVAAFARACCPKGMTFRAKDIDVLTAAVVYRELRAAGLPVPGAVRPPRA